MADQGNPNATGEVAVVEPAAGAEGAENTKTEEAGGTEGEGSAGTGEGDGGEGAKGEGDGGEPDLDSYAFELPEGMTLPEDTAAEVKAFAKEHNLTVKDAQKLVSLGVKQRQAEADAYAKTVEGWVATVKADKDIGGDKLQENLAVAKAAIKTFGDQELTDLLDGTRYGSHPAIVRFMYKVGKALAEDSVVQGAGKPQASGSKFYKNSNMK